MRKEQRRLQDGEKERFCKEKIKLSATEFVLLTEHIPPDKKKQQRFLLK